MEENTENKPEEQKEGTQETSGGDIQVQEDISLSDAMTGVFTEPRAAFEGVRDSKKRSYWLVPTIIVIIFTIVASFLVLNDEELYSEIKQMQRDAVVKRMEERVKEGKMTQEQMDQNLERTERFMDKSSPFFLISTILGPIVGGLIILFLRSLVLWLVLKIFKGAASYMLVVCVAGLTGLIDVISTVVNTVLAIITGRLTVNIGPSLLFTKDSVGENMMKFISHFDLISIWYLIVLGIGLSAISGLKNSKTMPMVFILWIIWVCIASFAGLSFTR
jgi:hypothetical protein